MVKSEDIYKREMKDKNIRLFEIVDLLLEMKLDEENGISLPTQSDIKSSCCSRLVKIYNGLKIQYMLNDTITKDEFEAKLYALLHEDEKIFEEAMEVVSIIKTKYKVDNVQEEM